MSELNTRETVEKAIADLTALADTDGTQLGEKAVNVQTIHALLTGCVALQLMDIVDALDTSGENIDDLRKVISSQG